MTYTKKKQPQTTETEHTILYGLTGLIAKMLKATSGKHSSS